MSYFKKDFTYYLDEMNFLKFIVTFYFGIYFDNTVKLFIDALKKKNTL